MLLLVLVVDVVGADVCAEFVVLAVLGGLLGLDPAADLMLSLENSHFDDVLFEVDSACHVEQQRKR